MELIVKKFDELTVRELHDILQARVAVFVVEQNCPYQDIDGYDPQAYHIYVRENGNIAAYARVLPVGRIRDISIGRVISTVRGKGYALAVMQKAIEVAQQKFGASLIRIEAQKYAKGFYEKLGFVQDSDDFLEDGIPHIEMIWKK